MIQYVYDAEGHRVGKGTISQWSCNTDSNGFQLTNEYILGQSGEQVTELEGDGDWIHTNAFAGGQLIATYDSLGLHYHLTDWLGTRRMQVSPTGALEQTCQSLPFGDQLDCVQTNSATSDDATEHHFTGYERDPESGNDYAQARYFASPTGRFISPDPSGLAYADQTDPQSLNLYSYVLNNPLLNTDPTGMYCAFDDGSSEKDPDHGGIDEDQCNTLKGHWTDDSNPCDNATSGCVATFDWNKPATFDAFLGDDGISFIQEDPLSVNGLRYGPISSGGLTPPANPCSSRNGRGYGPGHYARDYHLPANGTSIPAPEGGSVTSGRSNAPHIPGPYNYSQAAKPGTTNFTDFTGDSGYRIRYVHTHPAVPFNSPISQGQTIATSDMSGRTTGPHTHVQVTNPSGNRVDPNTYFSGCH